MRNPVTAKPNAERERIYREVLKELREQKSKLMAAPKITRNAANAVWKIKEAIAILDKELALWRKLND